MSLARMKQRRQALQQSLLNPNMNAGQLLATGLMLNETNQALEQQQSQLTDMFSKMQELPETEQGDFFQKSIPQLISMGEYDLANSMFQMNERRMAREASTKQAELTQQRHEEQMGLRQAQFAADEFYKSEALKLKKQEAEAKTTGIGSVLSNKNLPASYRETVLAADIRSRDEVSPADQQWLSQHDAKVARERQVNPQALAPTMQDRSVALGILSGSDAFQGLEGFRENLDKIQAGTDAGYLLNQVTTLGKAYQQEAASQGKSPMTSTQAMSKAWKSLKGTVKEGGWFSDSKLDRNMMEQLGTPAGSPAATATPQAAPAQAQAASALDTAMTQLRQSFPDASEKDITFTAKARNPELLTADELVTLGEAGVNVQNPEEVFNALDQFYGTQF